MVLDACRLTDTNRQAKFVVLNSTETLKLSFQVTEKESENGVQPHQAFLRFYDKSTGEEGIQPVKVGPTGKAKFELVRRVAHSSTQNP